MEHSVAHLRKVWFYTDVSLLTRVRFAADRVLTKCTSLFINWTLSYKIVWKATYDVGVCRQ